MLTRAAVEQGITFEVVQTWPGSREFERLLKRRKAGPRLCPVCGRSHPKGPLSILNDYEQLELPFEEWPAPPAFAGAGLASGPDWYELSYRRSFTVRNYTVGLGGDIPY